MNELTRAVEWAVGNPEAAVLLWILSICVVSGGVLLIFHFVERAVDVEMVKARDAAGEIAALKAERDAAVQNRCEVTEVCPHCESEITMTWDVAQAGYKAFCPVCGERLMLCDMCLHPEGEGGSCDYDSETDACEHNRGGET